ncbi:MAG TPA: hypothetical protein VFD20_06035 [Demequina sp.]|nr:hypothetical protein [Demequina sp.]
MCSPATCPNCGKATWTGCGNHVEQALAGIPKARRCEGHASGSTPGSTSSLFSRVFTR